MMSIVLCGFNVDAIFMFQHETWVFSPVNHACSNQMNTRPWPFNQKRLMSGEAKPDITSEECMKLLKELSETAEHLQRRLKVVNNMVLLMFGLSAGALVGVMAQNFSNKGDNAKWETHLEKSDDDLKRGMDLLNRTETSIVELKDLMRSPGSQSSDGPSKDALGQDSAPSEST